MSAKHTPGPWEQNYICAGSTNEVKANGKRIGLVLQYDEKQNRVADFQTCEANAVLMASAPELLEALQGLSAQVQMDCSIGSDPKYYDLLLKVQKAIAAIKKATAQEGGAA